jgi:glycosyltransferase involved in cell wall biosynthesis
MICQHNDESPILERMRGPAPEVMDRAELVVFVSERNRRTAERQMAAPIARAAVYQNPVNLHSWTAIPWPAIGGRMACVARLDVRTKGQDVLFEELARPKWAEREWRLSLFGEGPDRDYLAKLARFYGIAERVNFAGHVRDIARIWAEHEILLMPSRSEGTPLALIESLIAGRPAVVTDAGDSARWVSDGDTGFVAEATTAASFGNALDRAWARRFEWRQMGERARQVHGIRVDRAPGTTLLEAIMQSCERTKSLFERCQTV